MDLDADPEIFALFVNWVYCQNVAHPSGQAIRKEADYFYLWIMADRFLVPRLQNAVIETLAGKIKNHQRPVFQGSHKCIQYVYRNTRKGSPIRRLLLQRFMFGDKFREMKKCLELCPYEMLSEMYVIVVEVVPENVKVERIKISEFMVSEELPKRGGALSSSDEPL
jgi:hypothetical protein